MFLLRILAIVFWVLAVLTFALDLLETAEQGTFVTTVLGTWWYNVHPPSLNVLQVFFERTISLPSIWNPGITTLLLLPAWVVFAGLAFLLTMISRLFGRRRLLR